MLLSFLSSILTVSFFTALTILFAPQPTVGAPAPVCQPNFQGGTVKIRNAGSGKFWSVDSGANVGSPVKASSGGGVALLVQNNGQWPAAYNIR